VKFWWKEPTAQLERQWVPSTLERNSGGRNLRHFAKPKQ